MNTEYSMAPLQGRGHKLTVYRTEPCVSTAFMAIYMHIMLLNGAPR